MNLAYFLADPVRAIPHPEPRDNIRHANPAEFDIKAPVCDPPEPRQSDGAKYGVIRLVKEVEAFALDILCGALSFPQIFGIMA